MQPRSPYRAVRATSNPQQSSAMVATDARPWLIVNVDQDRTSCWRELVTSYLPRLVSGELDVSELDLELEAVS